MAKNKVVELFAGVGGFRLGLKDFDVVWSNQYEPSTNKQHASIVYEERFGKENHSNVDIEQVEMSEIPEHNLLVGGFPCFIKGTKVLTKNGHKSIEKLKENELVLTHKNNWKPIVKTMVNQTDEIYKLKIKGIHEIKTTSEHPFYVKEKISDKPKWVQAKDLNKNYYIGININKESIEYPYNGIEIPVNKTHKKHFNKIGKWLNNEDFWWIVGRYIADGWTTKVLNKKLNKYKHYTKICKGYNEDNLIAEKLNKLNWGFSEHKLKTSILYVLNGGIELYHFLQKFGHKAYKKHLTEDLINLPINLLKSFFDGYVSGDGSIGIDKYGREIIKITTTSEKLSYDLSRIINKLYLRQPVISKFKRKNKANIEGRIVNQKDTYTIHLRKNLIINNFTLLDDNYIWTRVRKIKKQKLDKKINVYNFEVKDDNSYVVQNLICHNCQDYSVATNNSKGLIGKKGVLWWSIERILKEKRPEYLFLENVDRLLKSPTKQRGRDFAVMLKSLDNLGYNVEWQMINAAEYGMPQRRRRLYILGYHKSAKPIDGVISKAFPVEIEEINEFTIEGSLVDITNNFNLGGKKSPFLNKGNLSNGKVYTTNIKPIYTGEQMLLRDVLESDVSDEFLIDNIDKWKYLKGAKKEMRVNKKHGFEYFFREGGMIFPDPIDKTSRTIITAEGGNSPSRFKHVIESKKGLRRLTPLELERLNMFPDNHTNIKGITDTKRAFLMGNALVVGVIEKIGNELFKMIK